MNLDALVIINKSMRMLTDVLRQQLFFWGYSTRCRNSDVAHILKKNVKSESTILDVGCGENGIKGFINFADVTGTDIHLPANRNDNSTFVCSDITSLPFSQGAYNVAVSIDVFEHLPAEIRIKAIEELVRVAKSAVLIAFPEGLMARQVDENYRRALAKTNKPEPDWLTEHLQNSYPEAESILPLLESTSSKYHGKFSVKTFYSERIEITRILRWVSPRSRLLLITLDLLFGLLLPILPKPTKDNKYRRIILISFQ